MLIGGRGREGRRGCVLVVQEGWYDEVREQYAFSVADECRVWYTLTNTLTWRGSAAIFLGSSIVRGTLSGVDNQRPVYHR